MVVALALSVLAAFTTYLPGDVAVAQAVQAMQTPAMDNAMEVISFLSGTLLSIGGVIAVVLVLAAMRRWPEMAAFWGVLLLDLAVRVPKLLIDRPRPLDDLVRVLDAGVSGSFPSGHTYHAIIFFGLALILFTEQIGSVWMRRAVASLLVGVIALTAVSRVYLGAHWPSDVLGAFAYGIPSLILLRYVSERVKARTTTKTPD